MSVELLITSGDGPVEVRWFVAALADAAAARLPVVARTVVGPDEAPLSVVLEVEEAGEAVADWVGVHALFRRSQRGRSRWFAAIVQLDPVVAPPALDPRDVEVRAVRGGGPGGQSVNTTSSAVIAVHRPTGTRVRVEDERSQHQNRRRALERLAVALARRAEEQRARGDQARWKQRHAVRRGDPDRRWRDRDGRLVEDG